MELYYPKKPIGSTEGTIELFRDLPAPPWSKDLDRASLHQVDQLSPTHPKGSRSEGLGIGVKTVTRVRGVNWSARPFTELDDSLWPCTMGPLHLPKFAFDHGPRPSMCQQIRGDVRILEPCTVEVINVFRSVPSTVRLRVTRRLNEGFISQRKQTASNIHAMPISPLVRNTYGLADSKCRLAYSPSQMSQSYADT